jgi:hypothetical protein
MKITSTIPKNVRTELCNSVEEIGQAMGLLREAITENDNGNHGGGQICASDAVEILAGLESKFSMMTAKLSTWSNIAAQ